MDQAVGHQVNQNNTKLHVREAHDAVSTYRRDVTLITEAKETFPKKRFWVKLKSCSLEQGCII